MHHFNCINGSLWAGLCRLGLPRATCTHLTQDQQPPTLQLCSTNPAMEQLLLPTHSKPSSANPTGTSPGLLPPQPQPRARRGKPSSRWERGEKHPVIHFCHQPRFNFHLSPQIWFSLASLAPSCAARQRCHMELIFVFINVSSPALRAARSIL